MRNLIIFFTSVFICLFIITSSLYASDTKSIIILHTNDIHGKVFPEFDKKDGIWKGGLASLSSMIKEIKVNNPDSVILLDGGDMFQGTPVSNLFQGDPVTEYMNYVGYDCVVMGNHEFDFGKDGFDKQSLKREFPLLCANIREKSTGKLPSFAKDNIVIERNGIKIGIIGVTIPFGQNYGKKSPMRDFYFEDPLKTIEENRDILKSKGIKTIGVLSHNGYEKDMEFAKKISGIDFIVGAHSHTYIDTADKNSVVPVFQAGEHGKALGFVKLNIDTESGKITSYESSLIPVIGYDMGLYYNMQVYETKVRDSMNEIIGYADDDILRERISEKSGTLKIGDFICDIIRQESNSDICFINTSSFKNGFTKGNIKKENLFYAIPYENSIVSYEVNGSSLKKILEYYVDRKTYTQLSGIECSYDSSRPKGQRVFDIRVGGNKLDENKIYKVATINFLYNFSDDCPEVMNSSNFGYCCGRVSDIVEKYIRSVKSIKAPAGIRINVINDDPTSNEGH